jgi:hypothetical protein
MVWFFAILLLLAGQPLLAFALAAIALMIKS